MNDHCGEVLSQKCPGIKPGPEARAGIMTSDAYSLQNKLHIPPLVNNNNDQNGCSNPIMCSGESCGCPDPTRCPAGARYTTAKFANLETLFGFKVPGQHYYNGIIMGGLSPLERLKQLEDFKVKDEDIIVSGYPKSGTTWLEEIVYLIQHDGDISLSNKTPIYLRVPYMEGYHDGYMLDNMDAPRVYKTHLPYRLLPGSILKSKPKIVHIVRNPRDTAVSYFHFHRALTELGNYTGTWKQFLEMFSCGYVCYGDWFTHSREWWNHRHDPNLMIVTYENMKSRPHSVIADIAHFCGKSLDEDTIDKIVEHTSFDSMKNNPMLNFKGVPNIDTNLSEFMRKGQVGDWKNYFTIAQNEKFHNLYQSKLGDLPDLPYSAQNFH